MVDKSVERWGFEPRSCKRYESVAPVDKSARLPISITIHLRTFPFHVAVLFPASHRFKAFTGGFPSAGLFMVK